MDVHGRKGDLNSMGRKMGRGRGKEMGFTHPSTKYLVNRSRFFQRTLLNHRLPHLFHEDHESIERLLDVLAGPSTSRSRSSSRCICAEQGWILRCRVG